MELGLRGRVALVTGASAGLGKAVALELAREGAIVALAARRQDELRTARDEAKAAGATDAASFIVDQSERGAMEALVRSVTSALGAPLVVIANGGGPKPGTFAATRLCDWDAGYDGTLRSVLELVYAALPAMRDAGWGRIVALTSTAVKQPIPNLVLSSAFRTALTSALKTLSGELAPSGVTVNAVATGRFDTDRFRKMYATEEAVREATRDVPAGRAGTPQEFSPLVAFLCGDGARYITGQTIAIDGGYVKALY